ncbi:MAG: CBS domain-containing protein [Flavobacteriaceae bacterium]|nr:CBS domain-containing protein [Flavobacteriaceae bacterium]
MKQRTPVSKIMTRDVITLNLNDNMELAEKLFETKHIRHIPIVSGKKVVGMLSHTDLMRISFSDLDEEENEINSVVYDLFTIEQVMAKSVISVTSETTIKEAAEILTKHEFHAVPVVDDDELVGIVTSTDLIQFLLDQF